MAPSSDPSGHLLPAGEKRTHAAASPFLARSRMLRPSRLRKGAGCRGNKKGGHEARLLLDCGSDQPAATGAPQPPQT
ncbi:hypothetical protein GFL91_27305 [Rhizobium leguminosarum bv. viciae]|uniref:Uncharacterized protein n=1 Tax=Rhizobium leguminosarum bv. viciae TaxID=387 RepID=A0A8I2GSY5_RHILV|nr:hypothetical protein [Rhizobium leguminosarum bv. viciae]NKM48605.1 hypothetical protein [Rhizobium leguminosarum bv. viciae]